MKLIAYFPSQDDTIPVRLRKLRKSRGLSQEQLAEILDSDVKTINNWENTKQNICPKIENLIELSEFYGVSIEHLLCKTTYTQIGNEEIEEITGLSELAINNLRDLKKAGALLDGINVLLENSLFYLEVIENVNMALEIRKSFYNPTVPADDKTQAMIDELRSKGFHVNTTSETYAGYSQAAGNGLTRILQIMGSDRIPGKIVKIKGLDNESQILNLPGIAYMKGITGGEER